ncbi:MAG: endopeptidase La, partial [Candidatus Cloacimonetes bacterium]|nr:endopeptidase La [Candidatus Cloacimonadota bacterium]
ESARIALSYLKAHHQQLNIDTKDFSSYDIHIHFPAGAVPKDGPSAGITLTTALASLFMQQKVKHDIAMTGEVTLQGKVLAIGGLKEKMLAAKRAGIRKLVIPEENKESIEDFDEEIVSGMEITFVSDVAQVLKALIMPAKNS